MRLAEVAGFRPRRIVNGRVEWVWCRCSICERSGSPSWRAWEDDVLCWVREDIEEATGGRERKGASPAPRRRLRADR